MTKTYDPTQDLYAQRSTAAISYARNGAVVTPSDSANLAPYAKALYVGGYASGTTPGDVTVVPINAASDSDTITFSKVIPGTILPIQVRKVMSTGTTATAIVALQD